MTKMENFYLNHSRPLHPGRCTCPGKMGAVSQLCFPPKSVVGSFKSLSCGRGKGPERQSRSEHQVIV